MRGYDQDHFAKPGPAAKANYPDEQETEPKDYSTSHAADPKARPAAVKTMADTSMDTDEGTRSTTTATRATNRATGPTGGRIYGAVAMPAADTGGEGIDQQVLTLDTASNTP